MADALGEVEGVETLVWAMDADPPRPEIDLVVMPYLGGREKLARLAGVRTRLVQSLWLGYDGVAESLPPGVTYANAASVHEASTAELAVALILASLRGIPGFVRAAAEGRWAQAFRPSLADRTVLLVGYGGVNRAVEDRLAPFEVSVARVARRARDDARGLVHGPDDLARLLGASDVVVVAVPLDDSTRGMVDDGFLSAMRDGALLVNVSRGPVADTDALVAHAATGRLALALDVTDPEPLPQGHPLWAMENVLISPHVGGATSAAWPRALSLIRGQAERMVAGEEPLNVVLRS